MQQRFSILAFFVTITATTAAAAPFTYTNERFGTVCTFPDEVFTDHLPEPENGDGQEWLSPDGASLICSGILNIEDTPEGFVAAERASGEPARSPTARLERLGGAVGFKGESTDDAASSER
jgi:hypothetical protein